MCPHDLREIVQGPVQALAIDEEGRRLVDSSSAAALDVGEDTLSKRVLAKGRVGLRWIELKFQCKPASSESSAARSAPGWSAGTGQ